MRAGLEASDLRVTRIGESVYFSGPACLARDQNPTDLSVSGELRAAATEPIRRSTGDSEFDAPTFCP